MAQDYYLPGMKPMRRLSLVPKRAEPLVWVRELVFLREFSPNGELRRIRLRRGLNVLWAKPSTTDTALFQGGGIPGHAAGKTTFCRLLRWVLGEGNFGDDELRDSIRSKLSRGGVAAEVVVNGVPWLVWREFRIGGHSYCRRGACLDELFSLAPPHAPFSDYTAALAEAVDAAPRSVVLPVSKAAICWDHLLPWLSRDQECALAEVLHWRDASSKSESPSPPAIDRSVVVRAILGTLAEDEEKAAAEHAALGERHRKAKDRLPLVQHQNGVELRRLVEELRQVKDGASIERLEEQKGDVLVVVSVERQYKGRFESSVAKRAELEVNLQLGKAQDELRKATEARQAAETSLAEDRRLLELDRLTLRSLRGEVQKGEEERWAALLDVPKGRCNVPLEVAIAEKCPLAKARIIDFPTEAELMRGKNEADAYELSIAAMASDLALREQALENLKSAEKSAQEALAGELRAHNQDLWNTADKERAYASVLAAATRAVAALNEAQQQPDVISALDKEVRESQKTLQELRSTHKQAQANFEAWLEWVVQAVLGETATASLQQRTDSFTVAIRNSGDRHSAAMKAVGVIAFDLAAMLCGCEGQGWHPGLLIHDSPRAADLSAAIYRKFFSLIAQEVEAAYGDSEPGFQYIVTTTEPPPVELQQPPWLLEPVLDASVPEGRLFGVDL